MNQHLTTKYDILYIVLGQSCNFKCIYCIQKSIKNPCHPIDSLDKIKSFILKAKPSKIMLWGGEPLIYWDQILSLVPWIKHVLPECKINMITNGSLLTAEKVEFINTYSIGVGLSHDGKATSVTRSKDVLSDPVIFNLFTKINNKGITTVLSAATQDIYSHWAYYDDLFGEFINVNFEPLKDFANNDDLQKLDSDKFKDTLRKISDGFITSVLSNDLNSREYLFFHRYIASKNSSLKSPLDINNRCYKVRCGVFNNALCLDLAGNIYLCKNSDIIVGTIDNIEAAEQEFRNYISIPEKCSSCEHLPMCGNASCVLATHEQRAKFCEIEGLIYEEFNNTLDRLLDILNNTGGTNEHCTILPS